MASGRAVSVLFLLALAVKGQQPFIFSPQQTSARQPFQSSVSRGTRPLDLRHQGAVHARQTHFGQQQQVQVVPQQQQQQQQAQQQAQQAHPVPQAQAQVATTPAPARPEPTTERQSSRRKSKSSRKSSSSASPQPEPAAPDQCQPSAAQLSALLAPRLEVAVRRALAAHKCGDPAALPGTQQPCDLRPAPLSQHSAPHREPAVRACAQSCLQLRDDEDPLPDGIYWLTGLPVPVYCDFTHDGGGWTLLLTAVSKDGWDLLSVLARNRRSPSMTDNYSILRYADTIKNLSDTDRFAYRIETQAETGRQRWGGVWLAPRYYSFVDETGAQTDVRLVRRFDRWTYKDLGIEQRMPWLRIQGGDTTVLTTSDALGANWWGTLVTHKLETTTNYRHSPWISPEALNSGTVLYWMREEEM
ncbi:hypothetical protein FJT64_006456 [Amphibalanus amphitrite]|uniref:Fibrinogen C-terminal domain-containing protein n=1 Tax=Amphibalanus amphitrite TaxID=1232801 RepID=A0A6A4VXB0_AMPAM|nr:hypothetical protein FJT64_006456 [Amphibalanus amphitrite]